MRLWRGTLIAAAVLLVPLAAYPQASREKSSGRTPEKPATARPDEKEKASLADATRVSTDEAARQAIKQKDQDKKDSSVASTDSNVVEFKPAPPAAKSDDSLVVTKSGDSKKLKKVHGEAYGATGAGGHREGGAAGATSKSGKTAVYVEADRSRTSPPR